MVQKYKDAGQETIILAGAEYGSGSSRDWAAKGPYLQVRVTTWAITCVDVVLASFGQRTLSLLTAARQEEQPKLLRILQGVRND